MELLAALIGARVEVDVDSLDRPFGILELQLLILVTLGSNLLLAFLLPGRRATVARQQPLLLMELPHKLLHLLALLRTLAFGVVYRAPQTALVTVGGIPRPLVTMWATTPTSRCNSSGSSGSPSQWLVAVGLLVVVVVVIFVAALSNDICIGLAGLPCLWGRL
jgi:hypothetical protein